MRQQILSHPCSETPQCSRCSTYNWRYVGTSQNDFLFFSRDITHHCQEAVVLARWLEMITLEVAAADPNNIHAQQLDSTSCFPESHPKPPSVLASLFHHWLAEDTCSYFCESWEYAQSDGCSRQWAFEDVPTQFGDLAEGKLFVSFGPQLFLGAC